MFIYLVVGKFEFSYNNVAMLASSGELKPKLKREQSGLIRIRAANSAEPAFLIGTARFS